MAFRFELLLVNLEGLLGKGERTLLDLLVLVCVHEVPVDVLHLRDGGDDLDLKRKVGDLAVALGDADVSLVGGAAKARQEGLCDLHIEIGITAQD